MRFLNAKIIQKNGLWVAEISYSYYYFWTDIKKRSFETKKEALLWISNHRCYHRLEIVPEEVIVYPSDRNVWARSSIIEHLGLKK